jgi:hypothetical protein
MYWVCINNGCTVKKAALWVCHWCASLVCFWTVLLAGGCVTWACGLKRQGVAAASLTT